MGFADLSIAEITTDYSIPVAKVFSLCNQLLIAYKHQKTLLALEDAKAIMSQLLAEVHQKGINDTVSNTDVA
ncbi:hypothetical protein NIES4103_37420 [Nostoc sp. NIES-4103]|nr:hypothetical protein NIES4103_37420 [Nostoc sp. NIES-4103]